MAKHIPDLREIDSKFTLEHCSVLQVRLGHFLDAVYGKDSDFSLIAEQMDSVQMRNDLLSLFSEQQLAILYRDEPGKYLLIGLFYGAFILPQIVTED